MLIDKPLNDFARQHLSPRFLKWFSGCKYTAMKFVFSDEVIEEVGGILRDDPSLVTHNLQFALPPYPETYIDIDYFKMLKILGSKMVADWDDYDNCLGFYFKNNVLSIFVSRLHDKDFMMAPMIYILPEGGIAPPSTIPMKIENEDHKLAHLLGTTFIHDKARLTPEITNWLLSVQYRLETDFSTILGKHNIRDYLQNSMGEFRVAMACLLWLNQKGHYEASPVTASRKLFKGKFTTYSSHHVVKLKFKPSLSAKRMRGLLTERAGPRRHEVRAYWHSRNCKKGCEHDWPMFPNENEHFVCSKCEGIRYRIEKHERGDAGRGYVTKDKYVT